MFDKTSAQRRSLVALLLASLILGAGCLGTGSDDDELDVDRFQAALAAAGLVIDPVDGQGTDVGMKILTPEFVEADGAHTITTGTHDLTLLLFDGDISSGENSTATAVTDATITVDAYHTEHLHGAYPEKDPAHSEDGNYAGTTTFSMPGSWLLYLNVTLAAGTALAFELNVEAQDAGADDADASSDDDENATDGGSAGDNGTDTNGTDGGNSTSGNNGTGGGELPEDISDSWSGTTDPTMIDDTDVRFDARDYDFGDNDSAAFNASVRATLTVAEAPPSNVASLKLVLRNETGAAVADSKLADVRQQRYEVTLETNVLEPGRYTLALEGIAVQSEYTIDLTVTFAEA